MLVLIQVSSMKTRRCGSKRPCQAFQRALRRTMSARHPHAACGQLVLQPMQRQMRRLLNPLYKGSVRLQNTPAMAAHLAGRNTWMLASNPASIMNHKSADLGIRRFRKEMNHLADRIQCHESAAPDVWRKPADTPSPVSTDLPCAGSPVVPSATPSDDDRRWRRAWSK